MDTQLFGLVSGYYGYDNIALSETVSMPSQMASIINDTHTGLDFSG